MAQAWAATRYGGPEVIELIDIDVPEPGPGQVTIDVKAAGVNPADFKAFSGQRGSDPGKLPIRMGYEVAGVLTAIGPDTQLANGGGAVGDEVVAFRVSGGYATSLTVDASSVFAKPANLAFPQAASLFLVAATAADMLRVVEPREGGTILVHGASGSVGVCVLQLARQRGVRAIGTAGERNFDKVREFGGEPIAYGDGLEARVRELAPDGVDASLDTVGTDEAVDVSLAVTKDPSKIVTIAAFGRAYKGDLIAIGGSMPESAKYRDSVRADLLRLAADGELVVPVARTFPFEEAVAALQLVAGEHPGGKVALVR